MDLITVASWVLVCVCISQSAMFSGLNLAVFGTSRLRLEVEASTGNPRAAKVLGLRTDSNFTLTTILWGNVAVNCLLTLVSESLLTGLMGFLFSTFVITLLGEIIPQGYCSRHALRTASFFLPVLRLYQFILYPVAKPSAKLLDWWLGTEGIQYFKERGLHELIKRHMQMEDAEIDRLEGLGALNFLAIDDLTVLDEGETVDPGSVLSLPVRDGQLQFPDYRQSVDDAFLRRVEASGKKWLVLTDPDNEPQLALDSDAFLRAAMFSSKAPPVSDFCHRPLIVRDNMTLLGQVLPGLSLRQVMEEKKSVERDIILVWTEHRRVITGTDILDRLLQGTQ